MPHPSHYPCDAIPAPMLSIGQSLCTHQGYHPKHLVALARSRRRSQGASLPQHAPLLPTTQRNDGERCSQLQACNAHAFVVSHRTMISSRAALNRNAGKPCGISLHSPWYLLSEPRAFAPTFLPPCDHVGPDFFFSFGRALASAAASSAAVLVPPAFFFFAASALAFIIALISSAVLGASVVSSCGAEFSPASAAFKAPSADAALLSASAFLRASSSAFFFARFAAALDCPSTLTSISFTSRAASSASASASSAVCFFSFFFTGSTGTGGGAGAGASFSSSSSSSSSSSLQRSSSSSSSSDSSDSTTRLLFFLFFAACRRCSACRLRRPLARFCSWRQSPSTSSVSPRSSSSATACAVTAVAAKAARRCGRRGEGALPLSCSSSWCPRIPRRKRRLCRRPPSS
mmetsp:Transcript_36161/g.95308  ORF Transcript_36161/g.95308 Transcript_36161/m.95308 type:complete len:403 (-) Transcript_36161:2487-3695(-)